MMDDPSDLRHAESSINETDRGHVLVSHSILTDQLGLLLESHFRSNNAKETVIEFLLKKRPMPPLGSFYLRATLSYACGLIEEQAYKTLLAVNELRNDAGHSAVRFRLSDKNVASLTRALGPEFAKGIAKNAKAEQEGIVRTNDKGFEWPAHYPRVFFDNVYRYLLCQIESPLQKDRRANQA